MNNNMKFPEGTLFVGETAFVPDADGCGYKSFKVEDGLNFDILSDNLAAEEAKSGGSAVSDIKFDVDYGFVKKSESAAPKTKINTKNNVESTNNIKSEKPKVVSVKFGENPQNKADESTKNDISENVRSINSKNVRNINAENAANDEFLSDSADENIHSGHRARLYERYEKLGLEGFAEHEVLEFLLYFTIKRRDTNVLAHRLINEFGSLENVLKADISDVKDVDGIGEQSALLINFCRQLIIFLNTYKKEGIPLPTEEEMGDFCTQYFSLHPEENFIVLILDTKRNLKKVAPISCGTENETAFYPRKVLKSVIKYRANTVVISHNHTGNNVHPSDNDIRITDQIYKLLEGIGVPLVDHIVCCNGRYTSLAERGMIGRKKYL